MPNDTTDDLAATATGLMDKVGTMLKDAVESVQDMAAELTADSAEMADAADEATIDGGEAMDDDEDDMEANDDADEGAADEDDADESDADEDDEDEDDADEGDDDSEEAKEVAAV